MSARIRYRVYDPKWTVISSDYLDRWFIYRPGSGDAGDRLDDSKDTFAEAIEHATKRAREAT